MRKLQSTNILGKGVYKIATEGTSDFRGAVQFICRELGKEWAEVVEMLATGEGIELNGQRYQILGAK